MVQLQTQLNAIHKRIAEAQNIVARQGFSCTVTRRARTC